MLNKFIGVGMVGKNGVELRYLPSGKANANFSLGIKRQFKNQEGQYEWDNITVVVWGKQAEACANYLNPKSMVAVDGRLQVRSYDGKDGQKRWITEIVAESVQFLDKKKESEDDFIAGEVTDEDVPF